MNFAVGFILILIGGLAGCGHFTCVQASTGILTAVLFGVLCKNADDSAIAAKAKYDRVKNNLDDDLSISESEPLEIQDT